MLHRSVMISRATIQLGAGALTGALGEILTCCMRESINGTLTGGLVWDSGWFMKVMEGETHALDTFCETVLRDERHCDVRRLEYRPVANREFLTWSVGTPHRSRAGKGIIRALQTVVPSAQEVQAHVSGILSRDRVAESPRLVYAA